MDMRRGESLAERGEEPQIPAGLMLPASYLILPSSPPLFSLTSFYLFFPSQNLFHYPLFSILLLFFSYSFLKPLRQLCRKQFEIP